MKKHSLSVMAVCHLLVAATVVVCLIGVCLLYGIIYPTAHKKEITFYANRFFVEPPLVFAIINVESSFDEKAVSKKGAIGLMQLLPQTAALMAEKLNENFSQDKLFESDTNIKYGCMYLSMLLSSFETDEAICAYNAGPTKVRTWLQNKDYSSDGKHLSKIPYLETKEYLKKVKKNLRFYQNKL